MTSISLTIELLSEHVIYNPGDAVKGLVNLNVAEQVIISRITVQILGVVVVKHGKNSDLQEPNQKTEEYICEEKCLYNSKENNVQALYTEPGAHVLPFTFLLPENIPSSFESLEGYIRYSITSTLEGVDISPLSEKIYISVNSPLDLNAIPKAQIPSSALIDKKSSAMCCAKTLLLARVHIPRRGYVPGEVILLNAEINNMDTKPIVAVKAQLVQVIAYHHKTWPRKVKRMATEITRGYILPNASQYWMEETLLIPPVVTSYLQHCKLIDIKYKIYFRIAKAGMPEIVLKLPIIIGNVPLIGCVNMLDHEETDKLYETPLEKAQKAYEPCFFGPHNVTENCNSQPTSIFSPRYTTYSM